MANTSQRNLFGRRVIYTSATEITPDNVIHEVVEKGYIGHAKNRGEIEYLYRYYKGDQPILYRTKTIRSDINNTVCENRANEIVSFKVGYLCGNPIQYISRSAEETVSSAVAKLNDYMMAEAKASKDKELLEWDAICGTAYRLVLPDASGDEDEAPFEVYTLDPRNSFVIYNNGVAHKPIAGVYFVENENESLVRERIYSVYTPTDYFEIKEKSVIKHEKHALGMIPIIEYPANTARIGAFEPVLSLLDAINKVDSNRLDGVEQFIQSLMIIYNAELPDDETATTIQQKGVVELRSVGENKADIKILSEQLNQSETQTLKDDLYQTVLTIVGMPSQSAGNTSDSSNNGAVILKNGWQGAEARAKDSELIFKQSEQEFLKLVLRICRDLSDVNLRVSDVEAHFTRRNYSDIQTKSQVLTTMLQSEKIAPKLAFQASGLFVDSEEAYRESMEWYEEQKTAQLTLAKAEAEAAAEQETEDEEPTPDRRTEQDRDEDK